MGFPITFLYGSSHHAGRALRSFRRMGAFALSFAQRLLWGGYACSARLQLMPLLMRVPGARLWLTTTPRPLIRALMPRLSMR